MGEMSREALEAINEGLRAALVEVARENGRLFVEAEMVRKSAADATAARDVAMGQRAEARAARDLAYKQVEVAKAEADARAAKDREQAQKDREQALHAKSKAAESQEAARRAETDATLATANYNRVSEAYNVAKLHREWADRRIQDLREALVAAGVAVPPERPLGKL